MKKLLALAFGILGACDSTEPAHRADWVIRSRIEFVAGEPAPLDSFRLWVPFTAGDFYGAPTSGSFIKVTVNPDYTFEIDLNKGHDALLKSLEKTAFSVAGMRIEPANARIARISAFLMQADGIEPIGTSDWVDAGTKQKLMLVYFDRPAHIAGPSRYDIRVSEAGYYWITQPDDPAIPFQATSRPQRLVLAVTRQN